MTKDKQAAEETAEKWGITHIRKWGFEAQALAPEVVGDIKYRLRRAFLAGCEHKEEKYRRLVEWAWKAATRNIEVACLCGESDKHTLKALDAIAELEELLKEVGE